MMLSQCLMLSAVLFAIGIYGVLSQPNVLMILMSVEIMLNAANVALVAFGRFHAATGGVTAHVFVLAVIAVAAAEAAVGLAILLAFFRNRPTTDVAEMRTLRG